MKIKILTIMLYLNIFDANSFKKKINFCKYYCSEKQKYKKKFIDFEIKKVKMSALVIDKIDICVRNCENYYSNKIHENIKSLPNELKNICTNGKDVKKLSNKEYLKEFAKSTCSPLVLLPGIFGTRLELEISNCFDFKKNYPDIYKICDLDECSKTDKNKPWKWYNLWLTDIFSPLSIFSFREKYLKCFANFMKVIYEFDNKNNKYKLVLKDGLKIKVKGLDEKNGKVSECGIQSTQNYAPFNFIERDSIGFKYITEYLLFMGYKNGLTFQYLPYDFRLGFEDNDLNILFKENVERLNKLTNKKIVLISHSLGGWNSLFQIKINEKYKINELIGNFITIGTPFFGSIKTVFSILNLFSDYYFHGFGINKKENEMISKTLKSVFQMIPPKPEKIVNKKWFKWVLNRIEHEVFQDEESYKKEGANLLPISNTFCYKYSSFKNNQCFYNFQNYFKPILKDTFNEKDYSWNKIEDLFKIYTNGEDVKNLYKYSKNDYFNYNPKIQHTFIFANSIKTLNKITYMRDISKEIKSDDYVYPDMIDYSNGDTTVPSFSVLFKAYKLAYEFEKEKNKGYKPIKILELCSIHNRISYKDKIYDNHNGKYNEFTKNSYNGINCECDDDKEKTNCSHSSMILDSKLIEILSNLMQLNEKIDLKEYNDFVDKLNENEIKKYTDECPQLKYLGYGYNKFI